MIGYLIKTLTDMKQENTMSKKFEYKYKLQKRLYRTACNPGHSEDKVWFREMRIKKLINRIKEK